MQVKLLMIASVLSLAVVVDAAKFAFAATDEGLADMHRVVEVACACAQTQRSGVAAAMACKGPREFGRLKVMHRDSWDQAARSRADDLEKVIQSCLSNASSAREARQALGQAPIHDDASVPSVYWRELAVDAIEAGSMLVRLRHKSPGSTLKTSTGMVLAVDGQQLELGLARRDGGGSMDIALADIERAWVMIVSPLPR